MHPTIAEIRTVVSMQPHAVGVFAVSEGDEPLVPRDPLDENRFGTRALPAARRLVALALEVERIQSRSPPLQSGQTRRGSPPGLVSVVSFVPQSGQNRLTANTPGFPSRNHRTAEGCNTDRSPLVQNGGLYGRYGRRNYL